jgi:NAD(P)-dependent dehydrogenase (short-subunit alcohol dehydrogenase family)
MAIDIDLNGRIAIVTGAGRGIGRAIALNLAKAGADVCATARSLEEIEQTARMVRETGRRALTVAGDATRSAVAAEVVARTVADLGGLHILVNNAGIDLPKPLIETTEDDYNLVMDTNVKSMVLFTQAAGPHLIAQRFGRIVNMASVGAFVAAPNRAIYHASKAAVAHLTRATAIEWARHGITVNAVAPGWVRTDLIRHLLDDEAMLSAYTKAIPMRRIAEPEEIGPLVVFLCSDLAGYMTGSVVVVDGGLMIP